MTKKIIWHFGFQKTGTTAIQNTFIANNVLLRDHLELFVKGKNTTRLRRAANEGITTGDPASSDRIADAVNEICEKMVQSSHQVGLFSDENILARDVYNEHGNIFEWAIKLLPVIEEQALPIRSEFVFYTRPFSSWLRSAYNQSVKARRYTVSFDEWMENIPFPSDWSPVRSNLCNSVKSPVHFVEMSEDAGRYIGATLLDHAGCSASTHEQVVPAKKTNESVPPRAISLMLRLNRSNISNQGLKIVKPVVTKCSRWL